MAWISLGIATVEKVIRTGEFHCRGCWQKSGYRIVRQTEWYSICGLPLVPRGSLGTHLICNTCGVEHDESAAGFSSPGDESAAGAWSCPQCGRPQKATFVRCPICKVRPDGTPT